MRLCEAPASSRHLPLEGQPLRAVFFFGHEVDIQIGNRPSGQLFTEQLNLECSLGCEIEADCRPDASAIRL
jgi:hypothetical protein